MIKEVNSPFPIGTAAGIHCPPNRLLCSISVTLCPFIAAETAASHPETPPPTTTTFFASSTGVISYSSSIPVSGFTRHLTQFPFPFSPLHPCKHPIQRITSSSLPSSTFFGISGSAREALAIVTRSALSACKTLSAISTSLILPTAITGISTTFLISAAFSTYAALGTTDGGMITCVDA